MWLEMFLFLGFSTSFIRRFFYSWFQFVSSVFVLSGNAVFRLFILLFCFFSSSFFLFAVVFVRFPVCNEFHSSLTSSLAKCMFAFVHKHNRQKHKKRFNWASFVQHCTLSFFSAILWHCFSTAALFTYSDDRLCTQSMFTKYSSYRWKPKICFNENQMMSNLIRKQRNLDVLQKNRKLFYQIPLFTNPIALK